jgi:toxin ParE1/3/4
MSLSVRILGRAWSDADAIFDWLAARSPAGAARWYAAFLKATQDLLDNPLRHEFAPESKLIEREIRHRFFKTRRGRVYRLLFVIVGDEIRILRVRGPGQSGVPGDGFDL